MRTRRGGVLYKIDDEPLNDQIHRILSDPLTMIEFISCGAYGFVFKVTYRGTESSGFKNPETDEAVNEFIIKVQSIDGVMMHYKKIEHTSKSIDWDKLISEVKMQQELYKKSLEQHGTAVCPAILYYEGITIEKFESFMKEKDQFIYLHSREIQPEYYGYFHLVMIVMEFVPSSDLEKAEQTIPRDPVIYWRRLQDLKNKAFTMYCMALLCGIDQNDVFGRNFLLSEDDRVTMIDFGKARKLSPEVVATIKGHIEAKTISELKTYLTMNEDRKPKGGSLSDWLFKKGWAKQPYDLELLDFPSRLPDDQLDTCLTGICKPTNTKPIRKAIERKRPAEPTPEKTEEKKTRCEEEVKEKGFCSVMGGKRTRRKVKGGVLSNISGEENRDQVYRILSHPLTKIEYMSRGKSGQIFKVISATDSGFVDEKKNPVKVFILKVQGIDVCLKHTSRNDPNRPKKDYEDFNDFYPYTEITPWDELSKEVRLQQKIYACALNDLVMPPCPAILFYESITAEEFERFLPGQFIYKVGEDKLERIKPIHSRDFNDYRMGIIFMEYVDGFDLSDLPHEIYVAKVYEIESKALRAYCTALQCGVLQGDPKRHNFILTKDDNVVLIDFGIARELKPEEKVEFEGLLQKAEAGNCDELRLKLSEIEKEDGNPCIDQFIFRERWKVYTPKKSGITQYPTLAPPIRLSKEIADQYKAGLYTPTPTLHDSKKMAYIQRRSMEAQDRIERAEAEQEELRLYSEQGKKPRFWGGKRKGTRRKSRTRRKI